MHLKTCLQLVAIWQGHGTLQKWRLPCDESLGMGLEVLLPRSTFCPPLLLDYGCTVMSRLHAHSCHHGRLYFLKL